MIDLSKKYRTRNGSETFGLCLRGDFIYGWVIHNFCPIPYRWVLDGKYVGGVSDLDLIEITPEEELLEEARRRYPEGTKGIPPGIGGIHTFSGDYIISAIGGVWDKKIEWNIYQDGQWAEIVRSHKVKVYLYMHPDGKYYTSTSELLEEELLDLIPIGSKEVEFFETIKS